MSDDLRGGLRLYFVETDDELMSGYYGSRCYWDFDSANRAADRATGADEDGMMSWGRVRGIALKGKPPTDSMTIAGHLWVDIDAARASDRLTPIPGFTRDDVYRGSMLEYNDALETLADIARDMYHDLQDANSQFGVSCLASKLRGYERRLSDAGMVDY